MVEEIEPPHFHELSAMQLQLVVADMKRAGEPWMREHGDDALRRAIDDDQKSPERVAQILLAQSPMLAPAVLGLPGLSVPTGLADGLPTGVQLIAARFREDRLLAAGEVIERAAAWSALDALFPI